MKRRTYIYLIIIVACLIYSVSDYFAAMRRSYNMYVEGEYYFRYEATIVNQHMNDDWWATPEAQNTDYSDPKNMLLRTTNETVYAVHPHDGVCTVYYGSNVIEDFPVSVLKFEGDDADYFKGSKLYSYDEYIAQLRAIIKAKDEKHRLSSKAMYAFEHYKFFMIGFVCIDAVFGVILILLYRAELYDRFNLLMFFTALYGIFFDVISTFLMWS